MYIVTVTYKSIGSGGGLYSVRVYNIQCVCFVIPFLRLFLKESVVAPWRLSAPEPGFSQRNDLFIKGRQLVCCESTEHQMIVQLTLLVLVLLPIDHRFKTGILYHFNVLHGGILHMRLSL